MVSMPMKFVLFMIKMHYVKKWPKYSSILFILKISLVVVVDQLRKKVNGSIVNVEQNRHVHSHNIAKKLLNRLKRVN